MDGLYRQDRVIHDGAAANDCFAIPPSPYIMGNDVENDGAEKIPRDGFNWIH